MKIATEQFIPTVAVDGDNNSTFTHLAINKPRTKGRLLNSLKINDCPFKFIRINMPEVYLLDNWVGTDIVDDFFSIPALAVSCSGIIKNKSFTPIAR